MILYLDTSAYVKLVFEEAGDADVREWFSSARRTASSVVTYAEASSAFARRAQCEHVLDTQRARWVAALDAHWKRTFGLRVAERLAGRLALDHLLRGMDAVQLAAAVTLRERLRAASLGDQIAFAAFDRRLLAAAEREGFQTLGGELG